MSATAKLWDIQQEAFLNPIWLRGAEDVSCKSDLDPLRTYENIGSLVFPGRVNQPHSN
jgi:hypothetical protein